MLRMVMLSLWSAVSVYATEKPNVIVIFADDLGWMDVVSNAARVMNVDPAECYYETPRIDQLAADGMTFTQAYAAALCSPARAALLTGQYPARFGFLTASANTNGSYDYINGTPPAGYHIFDQRKRDPENPNQVDPAQGFVPGTFTYALQSGQQLNGDEYDAYTIAEALEGYRSAMLGKWHLGAHGVAGYQPSDHGFEELAFTDAGGSHFFDWRTENIWQNSNVLYDENGDEIDYLTDDLTERAVRFIRECDQNNEPFFLYFPQLAVHKPLQAKPDDFAYFENKATRGWNGHSDPDYAGVLRGLDNSVGRVVDELNALGIAENTLLIFMSDNGGLDTVTSNHPLRGGKADLYEGGVRVPFIAYWPGTITPNTFCEIPIGVEDIFPTILSVANQSDDLSNLEMDGQSILPLLADPQNGANGYTRDTFFSHKAPRGSAVRKGDYKLVYDDQGYLELYNLAEDIEEKNNLAAKMPEKAQELFKLLDGMLDDVVPLKYQRIPNPFYDPEANAVSEDYRPYIDLRSPSVEVTKDIWDDSFDGGSLNANLSVNASADGSVTQTNGQLQMSISTTGGGQRAKVVTSSGQNGEVELGGADLYDFTDHQVSARFDIASFTGTPNTGGNFNVFHVGIGVLNNDGDVTTGVSINLEQRLNEEGVWWRFELEGFDSVIRPELNGLPSAFEFDLGGTTLTLRVEGTTFTTDSDTYSWTFNSGTADSYALMFGAYNRGTPVAGTQVTLDSFKVWLPVNVETFDVIYAPNLLSNGYLSQIANRSPNESGSFNINGSFGDASSFWGRTADLTGWSPYHTDPNGLTTNIGTAHQDDGGVPVLDGTIYLDTVMKTAGGVTLNSSMDYRNGLKQENVLADFSVSSNATYQLQVDVAQPNADTVQSNASFVAALTSGTGSDVTDTANAVGSVISIAADTLPDAVGTVQAQTISGSELQAAHALGPVNVIFEHENSTAIAGYPDSSPDPTLDAQVSQLEVCKVALVITVPEAGDVNKDGVIDAADLALAQTYLAGDGGESATNRQDALGARGVSNSDALELLNLIDFDVDGDGYFDATDVAAVEAIVSAPFDAQFSTDGAVVSFSWNSRAGKLYDLESTVSLSPPDWNPYNDGVTTHTNIEAGAGDTTTRNNVQVLGTTRFFRIKEK